MTTAEAIDQLLRRVRDPQGSAHLRDTVRNLLDRAQVLYVRKTMSLIQQRNVAATAERCLYELDPLASLRILDIFVAASQKRLWPVRWSNMFHQFGPAWWREATATGVPQVWAPVGTVHYIVWPPPTIGPVTLTIREQRRPTPLGNETIELELPDENIPELLDFVEAVLVLRGRDAALPAAMTQVEAQTA